MLKIGDRVMHAMYGVGELVTNPDEYGGVTVAFEKEFEVVVGKVIDLDDYFHDDRRLTVTRFIDVFDSELKRLKPSRTTFVLKDRNTHCHSCGKLLSSNTHRKCDSCNGWLICECGSCGCDYTGE